MVTTVQERKRNSPNFGFEHNDEERIIPTIPKKITTISVQSKISKAKTNTTWANEDVGNIHHNGDTANGAPPERHEGGHGSRKRYERILTESDTGKRSKQKDSSSHKKKFSGRFSPFNLEIGKFVSRKYKKAMSVPMRPKPDFQDATHTFVGGSHVGRSVSSDDMLVAEAIGLLHVHIAHRHTEEELVVAINRISEIDQADIRTKADGGISPALYVTGCIMPGQRRRFKTNDSAVSEEPRWEETFLLNDLSFSAIGQLALRFRFILRPAVGQRSIHLGSGTALLQDMEFGSSKDLDIPLIKPTFQHSELGDLHLSLCYQTEAQRLVCLILEAKDLAKTTAVGARTQSSVRIDVISGDRRLDRQKTSAVKETDNPVWNHQVVFPIPTDGSALQGVQFLFAVIQKDMVKGTHTVGQFIWHAVPFVRLFVGINEERIWEHDTVYEVVLGWDAVCEGLEHWQEVIQNPNRPIAAWHSLESPE